MQTATFKKLELANIGFFIVDETIEMIIKIVASSYLQLVCSLSSLETLTWWKMSVIK